MKNVEELYLQFLNKSQSLIDGNVLQKYFINHMSKLNKLTFNIGSLLRFDDENNIPSNEDIKKTFENFNDMIISNIDYFKQENKVYCHIYSYPYTSDFYYNITNNFFGGLFKSVHEISLHDEHPFEHDFFLQIAESFPRLKKLTLINDKPQQNKHLHHKIIQYHHLVNINLAEAHEDYIDEFLNEKKILLLNLVHFHIHYGKLKTITNDFTRDETRLNCSKIIHLKLSDKTEDFLDENFQKFFPRAQIF